MRIVLCYPVESQHLARIQSVWPEAELVDAGQERVAAELPEADIFCGHPRVPVPWDDVVRRGRLQWIQSSAAGLDHVLVPSVVASTIPVTSASGVLVRQVADQTFALLAGVLRGLPTFFQQQRDRDFTRRPTRDLHGARIGIVGLGGNGAWLAKVLKPLETTIVATDWFRERTSPFVDEVLPHDQLDDLLPTLDILILAAPLNSHTRGMIDGRRLRLLPRDAVLINVARGPLVVERDLCEVLADGHLWGAGVDVTEVEPLAPDSPLWDARNTIITPHVGGQRKSRVDDMTALFCENLRRWRAGKPLINFVDKTLGFPAQDATLYVP
jgi:phosphoglycerate dehydrogenase-like enzyme